jgi:DNA polymerase-3 subunit epsilon
VRIDRRRLAALLAPGAALALWTAGGAGLVWLVLGPDRRAAAATGLAAILAEHAAILALWLAAGAALGAWVVARLQDAWSVTAARMADATRVMIGAGSAPDLIPRGAAPLRALAAEINGLTAQRRILRDEMGAQVRQASQRVAQQRDQLAALMAELQQSVVVCNLEGRVLLYNTRAHALFRDLAPGGAELIGLGRSIHEVIDRALIDHAQETVERRIARGDANASARFVTATPGGRLLRVGFAPVRPEGAAMSGYVLLLDDITLDYEEHARRDAQLLGIAEASRASLASIQAALEMLDYPDLAPAERERFQQVVRDEVGAMGARLTGLADEAVRELRSRWPLQEMLGTDLMAAAARRIETETGQPVATEAQDPELWLAVDSFALIEALASLARRLAGAGPAPGLRLRLAPAGRRAHLDLAWSGGAVPPERLAEWQGAPMQLAAGQSPLSAREVVERQGGTLWVGHDRDRDFAYCRMLLPVATGAGELAPMAPRPEFYDFDLFAAGEGSRALDDQSLEAVAYTVFDTETTGLDPNEDEILEIGATRIVNGKLLRGECFTQIVDPGRSIPEAGIAIHGIRPEAVRGKPRIDAVLPAFRAFVSDTVMVGHNVAFDLRFFQLKEATTGVRFDRPVLDTLLLASLAYPNEESHGLEALAGRLGIEVADRHRALGDALMTAEVFLKLLPALERQGIRTLGEARAALETSWYARLRY